MTKLQQTWAEDFFKKWISQPLIDVENIKTRQNAVSEIISNSKARTKLAKLLSNTNDIERMGMRLANNTVNPRHFVGLKNSLMLIEDYQDVLKDLKSPLLNSFDGYEDLIDFAHILERTINDDPPSVLKDGNVIKPNVNAELDFFRDKLNNSDEFIKNYEEKLKNELGIKLKVDYNRNAGYFIEVTTSFLNNIPPYFIRRQTLKGAERFITQELREHETAVVQASVRAIDLEIEIFNNLKEYSKEFISKILDLAQKISVIDVIVSLANVAIENNYSKPEIINGYEFEVVEGRHPVIEKMIPMGEYISNDFNLYKYGENTRFMVLTGPNMSGKSTYMRQNALIAIMAQMGGYVSAKYAKVGIFDKIFTRVGASDDLSVGQSTFMLEMTETAYILNAATQKSMILIDEIGRGTSTYDGVAIAYAVAWYISQNIKARTIFTTHYHELNVLANLYPEIKNFKVLVAENDGEVEFLRKVVEGQASKSYGIHVAKMAGLPDEVIKFANSVMTNMQKKLLKQFANKQKNT
ncbi:MAG: DNA mismatch repair protein MutS [Candidatus Melainabacteria bacterium]|nr:MAG: DNA mismatch repair protein MutS [Candidatus Melainabacteria bacterium]